MKQLRAIAITLILLLSALPTFAQDCLVKQLRAETRGLTYQSEADSPVYVFFMAARTKRAKQFTQRAAVARATYGRLITFDEFTADLTHAESWHEEAEKKYRERYVKLFALMKATLHDLRVVYFGNEPEYQVYIYGRNFCGDYVGIRMKEVSS